MATHTASILRIKTLSRKTTRAARNEEVILVCARHNLREFLNAGHDIETSNINHHLTGLNVVLAGPNTAAAVASYAADLLKASNARVNRVNATVGAEVVFSLDASVPVDTTCFFGDCISWLAWYFRVPILSAVCHYDQQTPHCHALLLPLRENVWLGSKLFGNRSAVATMHESFHRIVGSKYNLPRKATRKRVPYKVRRQQSGELVAALAAKPELLGKPKVFDTLVQMIVLEPSKLATVMHYDLDAMDCKPRFNAPDTSA